MITEANLGEGVRGFTWPLQAGDRGALIAGYESLSLKSRSSRFLASIPHLTDAMLDHLVDEVDGLDHVALAFVVLDEDNRPGAHTWSGRPDVYPGYPALLLRQHPTGPSLSLRLR